MQFSYNPLVFGKNIQFIHQLHMPYLHRVNKVLHQEEPLQLSDCRVDLFHNNICGLMDFV